MEHSLEQTQHPQEPHETLTRLELLQQLKQAEVSEIEEPPVQFVVISLNGGLYGMRILAVREILKVPHITRLPCAPAYILGVISVRGDVHAVVDLKMFLHLEASHVTEQSRIMLVESGDLVAGLLIDDMVDIIDAPETSLLPLNDGSFSVIQQYMEGKLPWNEQLITILQLEAIIQNIVVDQT
ncbi:CheW protein [Candidatus Vecturithrix granuli]|uniref:CheW protein n=1 Tax=Vecturithrix granuli TaxID=1499967 RepID=A0A081C6P4_VECG1|nr:CheW protein [Candidatus Vecturithrix granuli]